MQWRLDLAPAGSDPLPDRATEPTTQTLDAGPPWVGVSSLPATGDPSQRAKALAHAEMTFYSQQLDLDLDWMTFRPVAGRRS